MADSQNDGQKKPESNPLLCRICGKPVGAETAKLNGDGKAVHVECYTPSLAADRRGKNSADPNEADGSGHRPWKVVAEQASHEQDPAKLTELLAELTQALDEQAIGKPPTFQAESAAQPEENLSGTPGLQQKEKREKS